MPADYTTQAQLQAAFDADELTLWTSGVDGDTLTVDGVTKAVWGANPITGAPFALKSVPADFIPHPVYAEIEADIAALEGNLSSLGIEQIDGLQDALDAPMPQGQVTGLTLNIAYTDSVSAISTGSHTQLVTRFYDSDEEAGTGARWSATGVVDEEKTGLNANGRLYDVNGREFVIDATPRPEWFGAKGNTDDAEAFVRASAATSSHRVDLSAGRQYLITSPCALPEINFNGHGATINGYNGQGFVTAGNVGLYGEITFAGFENAADREQQGTAYATCAIRILAGSDLDHLRVGKDVSFIRCRTGLRWCANDTNDQSVDSTSTLVTGYFKGSSDLIGQGVLLLRIGSVGSFEVTGGSHRRCIGNGREVCPLAVYVDGIANNSILYGAHGNIRVSSVYIDTVINRTTTGTSETGNSYECSGMKLSGHTVSVENCIVNNVTGVALDCEGIYLKAMRSSVVNCKMKNAGSVEGAINIKGTDPANAVDTSPYGHQCDVIGNIIAFDEYTHDNNGTLVDLLRTGISIAAPAGATVSGNKVIGANYTNFAIFGVVGSNNSGMSFCDNKSINTTSDRIVIIVGGLTNFSARNTEVIDPVVPVGGIIVYVVSNPGTGEIQRGLTFKNLQFDGGSINVDSATPTGVISWLYLDGGQMNVDGVRCDGVFFDVKAPNASIRPIYMHSAVSQTGRTVNNIRVENWNIFHPLLNDPVVYGTVVPESILINLQWTKSTTAAGNIMAQRVILKDGIGGLVSLDATACKTASADSRRRHRIEALYEGAGGAAVLVGATSLTTHGTATDLLAKQNLSTNQVHSMVAGVASTDVDWSVKFYADVR
jgi:hypothetical protein